MKHRSGLNKQLFWLYEGHGRMPSLFRWVLLVFDILTIGYFLASPFQTHAAGTHPVLDYLIGTVIALDVLARFWIARRKLRFVLRPMNIADFIVVFTMFAPLVTQNYAFLRVLRAVRIARAYHLLNRATRMSVYLRTHHELIDRVVNLMVFVFVMSAFVYADQVPKENTEIHNYIDALYFTVTTLTTTGYGDVLMQGMTGRILSIVIMLLGITLFLRMLRALFRPTGKVRQKCSSCGLTMHDPDAVHCKHCGEVIHIETEGRL